MRTLRGSALSAVAVAVVVLSGCSGGDDAGSGSAGATEQESPLSKYFDAVYGGDLSPEESEAQWAEQQQQQEEIVADCMQEQGFEYRPATYPGGSSYGDGSEWQPDDREWVGQYGYGAVRSPFTEESPVPEEEYVDVNADYVSSLSESEQQAYQEALYGPPVPEDQMDGEGSYEYDWTASGCTGLAQHEVAEEDPSQSEEFRPLFDAINELYEGASSWPGMAELDGEWSACMDAAGHGGFTAQADAQNTVYEDMNAFYETTGDGSEPMPAEPDQAALDALAEEEVELALADLGCREETDYRDRAAEISREAEEQFIADHQAELDALLAAAEQD